jgi:two-component system, OmpR family, sensor kinase
LRLKDRLALTLTLVTTVVLSASFFAVSVLVNRDETGDLDRAILAQAEAAAFKAVQRDPSHPTVTDGQGSIPELPTPTKRYVAIYSPEGALVSATRSFAGKEPEYLSLGASEPITSEGSAMNLTVQDVRLRGVIIPVGDHGERLLYAISRRSIDEDMRFLYEVFTGLLLAATLLTNLLARWLGVRLTRDVDAVTHVARSVAVGDLSARVGNAANGSAETAALGADLDHMIVKLDALMTAQRTFISHAAHELRSPLATIRGELQLALRRPRTAEEYRTAFEEVLGEVELLATLTEDLLVLARVQRISPESASTPIVEAIAEAVRMARGPAEAQGVRVREPGGLTLAIQVRGTKADIARAVRNLIDNAVEHSPAGGEVIVEAEQGERGLSLSIADQGAGVSPEDAPHIFSPFYRGSKDRSGDARGTGLGLAIVREIARGYGGDVRLDPSHHPGARFVLELPLASSLARRSDGQVSDGQVSDGQASDGQASDGQVSKSTGQRKS